MDFKKCIYFKEEVIFVAYPNFFTNRVVKLGGVNCFMHAVPYGSH